MVALELRPNTPVTHTIELTPSDLKYWRVINTHALSNNARGVKQHNLLSGFANPHIRYPLRLVGAEKMEKMGVKPFEAPPLFKQILSLVENQNHNSFREGVTWLLLKTGSSVIPHLTPSPMHKRPTADEELYLDVWNQFMFKCLSDTPRQWVDRIVQNQRPLFPLAERENIQNMRTGKRKL